MKQLDPNAKLLFYFTGVIGWLFFTGMIIFSVSIAYVSIDSFNTNAIAQEIFIGLIWLFVVPIPFAILSYENYKYELQKDRIYIEKGVIWKKYISIPYERVQNVDILRGPLARMFGLSDLQIQTAGSSTQLMVEGRLQGVSVEEANKLREEILSKISGKKQGL